MMLNQDHPVEYLLASGETHTVKEFIEKAFAHVGIVGQWTNSGLEEKLIYNNQILVQINPQFYRPAEVDLLLGNPEKAKNYLKWKPEISFDNLIKEMVDKDLKNV